MLDWITKAVFIGCHTDDEAIVAGTLHRLVRQGVEVHVMTIAPAAIESDRMGGLLSCAVVRKEWVRSLEIIGVDEANRSFLEFTPSADLHPWRQAICQRIYDFCEVEKPDAVFVLSPDDENTAHKIVAEESERVMRGRVPITIRCQYPWNFSLGRTNLYVRLTRQDMKAKQDSIAAYESQAFRYNYGEILTHAAIAQGLSVKVEAAETFEIIRAVI